MGDTIAIGKRYFPELAIHGRNYSDWEVDIRVNLTALALLQAINTDEEVDVQSEAKALVLIRHHLSLPLKRQYKTVSNPRLLWDALKSRFEHIKTINLPTALHEWVSLRVQDFTSVDLYNNELFRISSDLEMCGQKLDDKEQIEKTLATFHPTNMLISNQYRNMKFTKYSELIAYMLLAEQNSLLLMKNAKDRPPGTLPHPHSAIPETHFNAPRRDFRYSFRGRGGGRGCGRFQPRNEHLQEGTGQIATYRAKGSNTWTRDQSTNKEAIKQTKCFRCGTLGHVKKYCRAPKHLVELYQKYSVKQSYEAYGTCLDSTKIVPDIELTDIIPAIDPDTENQPEIHMVQITPTNKDIHLDELNSCIIDSGTSHTILRDKRYFKQITPSQRAITTIGGNCMLQEGNGPATMKLPQGTIIHIKNTIYAPKATRNLLSFKDMRENNLHVNTASKNSREVILLIRNTTRGDMIVETLHALPHGFYATLTQAFHAQPTNHTLTETWHDRLGHPGKSMFYRIIKDAQGIPREIHLGSIKLPCYPCSQGNMVIRPSPSNLLLMIPRFLKKLHADVCGPIYPSSGPFTCFLAIICASSKWSQVSLLSTRNLVFPRILTHILRLRNQFPEHPVKYLRVDNAGEFTSAIFNDFCISAGIDAEYPIPHVHFQNGLAESLIKRLQMIARPILMQSNLPATAWGHAILHSASLLQYRPSAFNSHSPHHLAYGTRPTVSHLRTFGCRVMVPILGPKKTKMGPQRQEGIYIGFDSPSIIQYLEPMTADVYKARFVDCNFFELQFPTLSNEKQKIELDLLQWTYKSEWDPRTTQTERETQRILHLTKILNELPDSFADVAKVTRSHVPAVNTPSRIDFAQPANKEAAPKAKRGRPPGSVDKQPRQRRQGRPETPPPPVEVSSILAKENEEMDINYNTTHEIWDRSITYSTPAFAFNIYNDIMNDLPDPKTINKAMKQPDWQQWKAGIESELNSLIVRKVFGPITEAPQNMHLTGFKWTFLKKRDATGSVIRHKARLVAKGYTQIPGRDFDMTYAPVMDVVTYRYLIAFSIYYNLAMHQMDVVTAYLYGTLDKEIHMEAPPELIERVNHHYHGEYSTISHTDTQLQHTNKDILLSTSREMSYKPNTNRNNKSVTSTKLAVRVLKSMYGLKQSGRTWYKKFQKDMLNMGFINQEITPCLFIKQNETEFVVVAIYVDDTTYLERRQS